MLLHISAPDPKGFPSGSNAGNVLKPKGAIRNRRLKSEALRCVNRRVCSRVLRARFRAKNDKHDAKTA